jgi:hypothetical protein
VPEDEMAGPTVEATVTPLPATSETSSRDIDAIDDAGDEAAEETGDQA